MKVLLEGRAHLPQLRSERLLICRHGRCALLLNGLLAAFFVIMGSFNGLVTLIGELIITCQFLEWFYFFLLLLLFIII